VLLGFDLVEPGAQVSLDRCGAGYVLDGVL